MSYALDRINEILRIDARVTGNRELKCQLMFDDGPDKGYVSADECDALGEAFTAMAAELRSPRVPTQKKGA